MAKPEFEFTPMSSVEFTPCTPHIEGLSEAVLARDDENDSVTRILKFEPGTDTSANGVLTHDFWEEVFIFEGSFVDLRLNRTFKAGDWAVRPPGMEHGPWLSETGARMFEVRYYQDSDTSHGRSSATVGERVAPKPSRSSFAAPPPPG